MMPVSDMARRRGRHGAAPPGLRPIPAALGNNARCTNNSAQQKPQINPNKLRSSVPPVPMKKPSKSPPTSDGSSSSDIPTNTRKLRSTVPPVPMKKSTKLQPVSDVSIPPSDIVGAKQLAADTASVQKMADQLKPDRVKTVTARLKPDCIKRVREKLRTECLHDITVACVKTMRKPKIEEYVAPTMECWVAGEEVMLNIFPKQEEGNSRNLELDESLTPIVADGQPFDQTREFYSRITSSRNDVQLVMYRLGDLLLQDELEGDKEDWLDHVMQLAVDVAAWKKRCEQSTDYREKTGKILGVEERKFKARATRTGNNLLDKVKGYARRFCPCLFGSRKKDEPSIASRTNSSLNIDDYF